MPSYTLDDVAEHFPIREAFKSAMDDFVWVGDDYGRKATLPKDMSYLQPRHLLGFVYVALKSGDVVISTQHDFEQAKRSIPAVYPPAAEFTPEQLKTDEVLRFFHYAHLPPKLAKISAPYAALALKTVTELPRCAERTKALNKLLEAKDCAVRANVYAEN